MKILLLVWIFGALGIGIGAVVVVGDHQYNVGNMLQSLTSTPTTTPAPVVQPTGSMNQWVTDGPISFYVFHAQPGPKWADDDYSPYTSPPPGKIMGLDIYVSGTGAVPSTYRVENVMLRDEQGRLYAPTRATMNSITRQVELNPGTMSGLIALDFAVPLMTDISQYTLVVHSSPDSVGVAIPLHNIGWAT